MNDLYPDWILRKFKTLLKKMLNTFDGHLIALEHKGILDSHWGYWILIGDTKLLISYPVQ